MTPSLTARRPDSPRLLPALIVLGIVAIVFGGGLALSLADGHTSTSPPQVGKKTADGLNAQPARAALSPITSANQPPADIIGALVLPSGAVVSGHVNDDRGVSTYDRGITFKAAASQSAISGFYQRQLRRLGWTNTSITTEPSGQIEIFARHSSSDGYYWEVGVVVTSSNPTISPALSGGNATPTSSVELRIFEVDDEE